MGNLKGFLKVGVVLIVLLLVFYYTGDRVKENKLLESLPKQVTAIPEQNDGVGAAITQSSRPANGLSTYVGKSTEELIEKMGEPDRIEPSSYGYNWWIYFKDFNFMAGVTDEGQINQIYTGNLLSNVTPFEIGQSVEDIYRFTIVESEVNIPIDDNVYTFSLNGDDLKNRLLIIYKDLYAQLYVDKLDGVLEGVRFIDPATLVLHQPYDMTFTGEMPVPHVPSSTVQVEVDRAAERQIFELTNSFRSKRNLAELEMDYKLKVVAQKHSKDLMLGSYSSSQALEPENLTNRLKEAGIDKKRAGENIASNYVDAIEVVHGWLNSSAHRKVMLDKYFTHIGTGAFGKFYTESLILKNTDDERRE